VVDKDGGQLGVMTKQDALAAAKTQGKDLVMVAPAAKPPVAKIVDFANFKYQQQKKQKSGGKTKSSELKEIRLTPFIADNDFQTRIRKGREFLEEGDRLKINVKFVGRQITRKEFGFELMDRVKTQLTDIGLVDQEPKMIGRMLTMTVKPNKKQK